MNTIPRFENYSNDDILKQLEIDKSNTGYEIMNDDDIYLIHF